MSGCPVEIVPPNDWRREQCGARPYHDGLCWWHHQMTQRDAIFRASLAAPLVVRLTTGISWTH